MSQDSYKKISFPRYKALIKKAERQTKIKDFVWNLFTIFCQLVGVLYVAFIGYIFLSSLFSHESSEPEDRVEKADYSPYSGWAYE